MLHELTWTESNKARKTMGVKTFNTPSVVCISEGKDECYEGQLMFFHFTIVDCAK